MAIGFIIGLIIVVAWFVAKKRDSSTGQERTADNFRPSNKIKGSIGRFGLETWWTTTFTEDERAHIVETFSEDLIKGNPSDDETAIKLFGNLSIWFKKEDDRTIAYRILKKAEELIKPASEILDVHFLYNSEIEIYYKYRHKDAFALQATIDACKKQIAISPQAKLAFKKEYKGEPLPTHVGFETLIKIEEDNAIVIELATRASKEGWFGNWKKIIKESKQLINKE